jgi:hypothetical protein
MPRPLVQRIIDAPINWSSPPSDEVPAATLRHPRNKRIAPATHSTSPHPDASRRPLHRPREPPDPSPTTTPGRISGELTGTLTHSELSPSTPFRPLDPDPVATIGHLTQSVWNDPDHQIPFRSNGSGSKSGRTGISQWHHATWPVSRGKIENRFRN